MRRVLLLLAFLLPQILTVCYAEIPIVIYNEEDGNVVNDAAALRDTLGVNYVYGNVQSAHVSALKAAGFGLIKWTGGNDLVNQISGRSYFIASAIDSTSFPKFEVRHGSASGNYWVSEDTGMALDYFWIQQNMRSGFSVDSLPRVFFANIRMAIDPTNMTSDSLIGRILVMRLQINSTTHETTYVERANIPIYPDSSLLAGDMVEVPSNNNSFALGGANEDGCWPVKYSFWNSGKTTVYLDYLKCYDLVGRQLVEDTVYNAMIIDSVTTPPWNQVDYWWLRDEPKYDQLLTTRHLEKIIADSTLSIKQTTR